MQLRTLLKFLFPHFRPQPFRCFYSLHQATVPAKILLNKADLLNLQDMERLLKLMTVLAFTFALMIMGADEACAQKWWKKSEKKITVTETKLSTEPQEDRQDFLPYFIEGSDTVYYDTIDPSKVYSKIPKQKGKEWRQYYRLVHNFSKAYPYALVARKLVIEADSIIAADKLKGAKREKYVNSVQKELFDVFEGQMRSLTVSQGALIMKLVDREVGKSSYNIIKGYKSGITAGFWQGIAKVFGSDLKKPYDPEGEDKETEELVKIWEDGEFPALYWSLFWQDPPELDIPEKYL